MRGSLLGSGLLLVCSLGCGSSEPKPARTAQEPPAETSEAPEVRLPLERDQIRPVVEAQYPAVNGCHAVEFGGDREAEGEMIVEWEITPSGTVKNPHVVSSSFANPDIERCVTEVTKGFKFPEAGTSTEVNWKFKFRSRSE